MPIGGAKQPRFWKFRQGKSILRCARQASGCWVVAPARCQQRAARARAINAPYRFTLYVNVYAGYLRGFKSAIIDMAQPVQLTNGPAPLTFVPEIVYA